MFLRKGEQAKRTRSFNPQHLPEGSLEIFEEKERLLTVGEQLIWLRTDKQLGLYKGERLTVKEITPQKIHFARSVEFWTMDFLKEAEQSHLAF